MKRRSDAAIRQQYVTQRRKDSGLITKRIHVSNVALDKLDAIGTKLGFSSKELRNSENLSAIIELCLSTFLDGSFEGKANRKEALYLMQIHNIAKFKKQQGFNDKAISNFLEDSGYETPFIAKRVVNTQKYRLRMVEKWTDMLVGRLKKESYVQKQTQLIGECHRPKRIIRKKPHVRRECEVFRDEDFSI
ncbi:hypothetical protein P7M45_14450 [Vibrio parahaemolyticus]|nr:hypothetical protein [Vibrio parahaemolyticus]MDG2588165.1 hypothetical protein [Vibrio parahaemolyticus]